MMIVVLPQSIQESVGVVPRLGHDRIFGHHYSPTVLPFQAILSERRTKRAVTKTIKAVKASSSNNPKYERVSQKWRYQSHKAY